MDCESEAVAFAATIATPADFPQSVTREPFQPKNKSVEKEAYFLDLFDDGFRPIPWDGGSRVPGCVKTPRSKKATPTIAF